MVEERVTRSFGPMVWLVLVVLLFVGCSSAPATGPAIYRSGTFTAVGPGLHGDIKVEVTFSATKIVAVKVLESSETKGLGDEALATLADTIVEKQSVEVDALSGATVSSNALLGAVTDCVKQARLAP